MVKFADEALITVSSGRGGNGCIAFRREKYIPNGGPNGGDGGKGGDLVFEIKRNLRTLAYLRYRQTFKAKSGGGGEGNKRYGKDGEDCVIPLPPGTILRDADTLEVIKDFGFETEGRWVFLKGGNGGWGNVHFKGPTNQAPRTALPGQDGETRKIRVELNIIADIGFVGFPNAGKSSLLDYYTNARPKIAPYPFTTKIPNLGVLRVDEEQDIILADIPGIIEGASEGHGLGIRFLKHISRSAGLAFLLDLSEENVLESYDKLEFELGEFSEALRDKKRIVIANKLDVPEGPERLAALRADFAVKHPEISIIGISVHNRWGLDEVKDAFIDMVNGSGFGNESRGGIAGVMNAQQPVPDFMQAELEDDPWGYPQPEEGDFGATVSINRKKRGKKK